MKKALSLGLSLVLLLILVLPGFAAAGDRPVLTIGETSYRAAPRMSGADQLGLWKYLSDRLGVEFRHVYMTEEEYEAALADGNLPDIVSTQNNLAVILENGLALDAEPYLEEYVPNFLKGDAGLSYQVIR